VVRDGRWASWELFMLVYLGAGLELGWAPVLGCAVAHGPACAMSRGIRL